MRGLLDTQGGAAVGYRLNMPRRPAGLLNVPVLPPDPAEAAHGLLGMTPVIGDAMSAYDMVQGVRAGDWWQAVLGALGLLPLIPGVSRMMRGANTGDTGVGVWYNAKETPLPRGIGDNNPLSSEVGRHVRGDVDPEGRPLSAPIVAGIRETGGPDIPLTLDEELQVAKNFARTVDLNAPAREFKRGTVGHVRTVPTLP